MARGGKREGSGRKSKADEVELIERLSPLDDIAMKALEQGVKAGEYNYVKMFMEYRYGKPKETVKATLDATMQWVENKTYIKPSGTNS